PVPRQPGDRDGGACRAIVCGKVAVAHLAEGRQVRAVDEIVVEFHDVAKLRADRGERSFQILERLHRLRADVVADDLPVAADAELSSDVDDARRRGDLDHMGVSGRLSQRLRIDESRLAHASSYLPSLTPIV